MRDVNLLPRDAQREHLEETRGPLLVVAGGLAAVTAVALVLSLFASRSADDRRAELAAVNASIASVPKPGRPVVSTDALARERADRVAALASALSTRVSVDRLLGQLGRVLPEDAWLTGLTAAVPAAGASSGAPSGSAPSSASSGGQGVTIQGATYSHEGVARVLARLSLIGVLDDVRLVASTRVQPQADAADGSKRVSGKTVVTFTIAANLRTGRTS